jgi:hypothetical protein
MMRIDLTNLGGECSDVLLTGRGFLKEEERVSARSASTGGGHRKTKTEC